MTFLVVGDAGHHRCALGPVFLTIVATGGGSRSSPKSAQAGLGRGLRLCVLNGLPGPWAALWADSHTPGSPPRGLLPKSRSFPDLDRIIALRRKSTMGSLSTKAKS